MPEMRLMRVSQNVKNWLDDLIDSGVVPVSNRRITYNDAINYLIGFYEGANE